jgi:hypothetical protein
MKTIYLLLAVPGFVLPNFFVIRESIASGNIWMSTDPATTVRALFANNFTSAFVSDVLWVAVVFAVWSFVEARRTGVRHLWLYWLGIVGFGLAGPAAMFLYARERRRTQAVSRPAA